MAAVFDVSNFNLVSGSDLVVNTQYHIVDEGFVCIGIYQGQEDGHYLFVETDGNVIRAPVFLGYIEYYVPKPPVRIRRSDKAS